jgi:hypothetical protein
VKQGSDSARYRRSWAASVAMFTPFSCQSLLPLCSTPCSVKDFSNRPMVVRSRPPSRLTRRADGDVPSSRMSSSRPCSRARLRVCSMKLPFHVDDQAAESRAQQAVQGGQDDAGGLAPARAAEHEHVVRALQEADSAALVEGTETSALILGLRAGLGRFVLRQESDLPLARLGGILPRRCRRLKIPRVPPGLFIFLLLFLRHGMPPAALVARRAACVGKGIPHTNSISQQLIN